MSLPRPGATQRPSRPWETAAGAAQSADPGAPPRLEGTSADLVLRRLELTVRRRLDGLLQGNHLGLVPGAGSEAGESRVYHPGDDVRRMDWPVTARTGVAHVRETIADRELETWVVVDLSPSLDFGTAACEKRDLAVAGMSAVVYLTTHGGNRVGAVVTTGERVIRIPARSGRAAGDRLIRTVIETPRAEQGRRGDLAATLEMLRRPPRRRGLVVVVSDFLGDATWERPLRGLAARHEVLAIEVLDPRELSLPDVGLLTLVDPESGRTIEVQTGKKELREQFAAAAAQQRSEVAAGLRRCAAGHLQLRTDRDWLVDIVKFVAARRRGASGGARR